MIPAFFVFLSNTGGSTLLNDATNIMNQASATCSADDRGENQMKDATRENPVKTTHTDLKRKMEVRHLRMISLGGVIGTGLFLSSGYTINQAGPLGTVIAYAIGAVIVYLIMLSLGELSVAMPETGSFHVYATKFIGPGTGFTVAILYWLTWTVALGSEFTAAGLICANGSPARRYGFRVPCSSW